MGQPISLNTLIAGNSLRLKHYNVTGNGKREGMKRFSIGQSAAKRRTGEGSTTIS